MIVSFDRGLSLAFDSTHLLGMVMVVGECPVDISHIQIMAISDRSWIEFPLFDLFFDELNRNSSAFEMRLVVEFPHDTSRDLTHTADYVAILLERLG